MSTEPKFDPPRRGPRAPVVIDAVVVAGSEAYAVATRDLSLGGVRLSIPKPPWTPKAKLRLRLSLKVDAERVEDVTLGCAVVWCSDSELGAEFVDMTDRDRELVDRAVKLAIAETESFASDATPALPSGSDRG